MLNCFYPGLRVMKRPQVNNPKKDRRPRNSETEKCWFLFLRQVSVLNSLDNDFLNSLTVLTPLFSCPEQKQETAVSHHSENSLPAPEDCY